jgi:hypothetical protein
VPLEDPIMLKAIAILSAIVLALVVLCQMSFWPLELGMGLFGAGLGVAGALFGAMVSTAVGLLVALFALPIALGATALGLLVAALAVIGALLAVFVPLAIPVLALVGLVWLIAQAGNSSTQPPRLPAA